MRTRVSRAGLASAHLVLGPLLSDMEKEGRSSYVRKYTALDLEHGKRGGSGKGREGKGGGKCLT